MRVEGKEVCGMAEGFVLDREGMDRVEEFAAKFEQLCIFIDFVHDFVWQGINDGSEGEWIERLGCLTEVLSDVAHVRDAELDSLIADAIRARDPERG